MAWNQYLTELRDLLADLYPEEGTSRVIVDQAGVNPH